MNALLLGMSMSGGCMTHCGTIFLPILLCEPKNRWRLAGVFFSTRMLGYLCFALMSFYAGNLFSSFDLTNQYILKGVITLLTAILIALYTWNLYKKQNCKQLCSRKSNKWTFHQFKNHSFSYSAKAGFMTGISFCAPFWVICAECMQQGSIMKSILTFLLFYLGTSLLMLPLLLCGWIRPNRQIQQIGLLASLCITLIYFIQGTSLLLGAIYEKL